MSASPSNLRQSKDSRKAFTLIELLMVFGIIGILAAITFGISSGVRNAQNRAQTKVELAVISQALEEYKARYGDYPWHDSNTGSYPVVENPEHPEEAIEVTNVMLFYALTGRLKFDAQRSDDQVYKVDDDLEHVDVAKSPKFIDISKFSYLSDDDGNPVALLDPWGNPYIYWYKWEDTPDQWDVFGYHLYSTGPNGKEANDALKGKITESTGILNPDFRAVADAEGIIFAGE